MSRAITMGLILLVVSATQVAADCTRSDLEGRWRYFAIVHITNEEGIVVFSLAEACRFRIDSDARITSADCDDDGGTGERAEFIDERIKLENDCSFELNTEFCDYIGQAASDKRTATGVAFCRFAAEGDQLDRAMFNLIKE
jgi:hypothetical protein